MKFNNNVSVTSKNKGLSAKGGINIFDEKIETDIYIDSLTFRRFADTTPITETYRVIWVKDYNDILLEYTNKAKTKDETIKKLKSKSKVLTIDETSINNMILNDIHANTYTHRQEYQMYICGNVSHVKEPRDGTGTAEVRAKKDTITGSIGGPARTGLSITPQIYQQTVENNKNQVLIKICDQNSAPIQVTGQITQIDNLFLGQIHGHPPPGPNSGLDTHTDRMSEDDHIVAMTEGVNIYAVDAYKPQNAGASHIYRVTGKGTKESFHNIDLLRPPTGIPPPDKIFCSIDLNPYTNNLSTNCKLGKDALDFYSKQGHPKGDQKAIYLRRNF